MITVELDLVNKDPPLIQIECTIKETTVKCCWLIRHFHY